MKKIGMCRGVHSKCSEQQTQKSDVPKWRVQKRSALSYRSCSLEEWLFIGTNAIL